jgi:putative membrane protein
MPGAPTDHLANERTFLAWVRTAITIMALGFVVARFVLFLKETGGTAGGPSTTVSVAIGVLLVLAGTAVLLASQFRFRRVRADLLAGRFEARDDLEWILTAILVVVGVALAVYLVGAA